MATRIIQGDQQVSVHLTITIQKVTSNVQSVPRHLQTFIDTLNCVLEDRVQYRTVHIPNVFRDGNLQIISCVGDCNRQVHRDFLITLYIPAYAVYLKVLKTRVLTTISLLRLFPFIIGPFVSVIFAYPSPKRGAVRRNMKHSPLWISKECLQFPFYSTEILLTNGFNTDSNVIF